MKILQVTPTYFSDKSVIGGGERYVSNVCSALISVSKPGSTQCDILSFGEEKGLSIKPGVDMIVIDGDPNNITSFAGEKLDNIVEEYDVIHVHQCLLPFGLFIAARAKLANKFVIGTDHGGGEYGNLESFPRLGRLFDIFHAQSEFAKSAFSQLTTPIEVIRGPSDEDSFPLRRRHHHAEGPIISIGRILPHKGFEMIIEAMPEDSELQVVGRPHDSAYLDHLNTKAEGKNVKFKTSLNDEEIKQLLEKASVYVHASTHFGYNGDFYHKPELLAIAPIEAMMSGVPTLVSSAGALPELTFMNGCMGFKDQKELKICLQSKEYIHKYQAAEKIRRDAVKYYGLEQFGNQYLNMLKKCGIGAE
jgi:glycosyltransferase involved in cell wall biosynthesis